MNDRPLVLVHHDDARRAPLVARTLRAVERFGAARACDTAELSGRLAACSGAAWILRAGCWLARARAFAIPQPSASGRPLVALGAVLPSPSIGRSSEARWWQEALLTTGGDFDAHATLPPITSAFLESPLPQSVARHLQHTGSLAIAIARAAVEARARVARVPALDVHCDARLRVAQVVTSLQRGGAERLAIELAAQLPRCHISSFVVVLGAPTRRAFAPPPGCIDLAARRFRGAEDRAAALHETLRETGTDLVHGHLLTSEVIAMLRARWPVVLTVHNEAPGWVSGTAALSHSDAALIIACSSAVERDLATAQVSAPVRTVWNGIDAASFAPSAEPVAAARMWRERLAIEPHALVLLAIANPRPQKQLHRLPAIAHATTRLLDRPVHVVIAGEASRHGGDAMRYIDAIEHEARRLALAHRVHLVGDVEDVASLLPAADVLVCCSAHEGLSLAQLEALAAGRPVVTTAVGGSDDLARDHAAVHVIARDATPEQFAAAVSRAVATAAPITLTADFTIASMAARHARLYSRALAAVNRHGSGDGLWLVTNNFSMGGAQSSARRLLAQLHRDGVRVRAATLQEHDDHPTPGLEHVRAAGIPVLAVPAGIDAARATTTLVAAIDADPPRAVLLWNVIPEHKIWLADQLLDIAVFDVSPGEMCYASFERYFAHPRIGLPHRCASDYGKRLRGVIVKYEGERARAERVLRAPVHVIRNGIAVPDSPPVRNAASAPLVIGTLVRLHPDKRLELLLEALRTAAPDLPPHVLRIAGDPDPGCEDYAAKLRREAAPLCVQWMPAVSEPWSFLQSLDLFAMIAEPAGCPNASLEAMAAGLPVLITDWGGAREQVDDGWNGRVVARNDVAGLARALVELARDRDRLHAMGRNSHARARHEFSVARMAAQYRSVCLNEEPLPIAATRPAAIVVPTA